MAEETWTELGGQGERIQAAGAGTEEEALAAWKRYLERELVFPFEAEIARIEGGGPLQEGDKVTVTGITGEWQGIVVLMRHQYGLSPFPLADLVVPGDSPASRPVGDYQAWFARQKA